MYKKVTGNGFNPHNHLQIAKALFIFFNLFVFTIYGFLLLIFKEFPLDLAEESLFALNLFGIATGVALTFSILNLVGDALYCYVRQNKSANMSNMSFTLQYAGADIHHVSES